MRRNRRLSIALAALTLGSLIAPGAVSATPPADVGGDNPAGIAFRGDDLLVADAGTGRLLAFAPGGGSTVQLADLLPGVYNRGVTGVAVDGNGNAYAAIAEDGVVLFVTPGGDSGVYARGLGVPNGIAFDDAGNLYVADQAARRVLRVSPDREITTVADGFQADPFGVAFDPDGVLHVSTHRDGKVWKVEGGAAAAVASPGGTAEGIAFDTEGTLYVGDGQAGIVYRVAPGGTVPLASGLAGPLNLAFHGTGIHVATQGEGAGSIDDRVVRIEAGVDGLPLARPLLEPSALPDAPAHSVAHTAGGVAVDPAPFLELLPEGTATSVGLGAFEPTVGVSDTGAVFYNPKPTAGVNTQHIMRSTDGGKTWEDVSPTVPATNQIVPPTDLDPYVYVDRDTGRVFTVQLYVGCSYLHYSDDDGETWIPNPLACGVPVNDHQSFYAGPTSTLPTTPAYPNALYYCWNAIAFSGCGRSLDGGITFEPAGIPFPPGGCTGLTGHVSVGPEGTVYLPKADCGQGPLVAISRDDGTTWERVTAAGPQYASVEHESHIATDEAGNVYFVWEGPDKLPYLAVSTDQGRTWGEPMMVGAPGVRDIWGPSVEAGDDGRIAIYYSGSPSDCCYAARQGSEKMWNAYATISIDATAAEPTFLTTTFNDPRDPLRRGSCGPGRCGARPRSFGDFLEVFVDHTGRTWAAVVDTCTGGCANAGLSGSINNELGMVGQLVRGPKLIGEGLLEPPAWYEG